MALFPTAGPIQALRKASPQAVYHFTRFDQVNQLVGASEANADLGLVAIGQELADDRSERISF